MTLLKNVTAKNLKDAAQYLVIYVLIFSMLILILYLIRVKIAEGNKDILLILIGAFAAKFSDAVAFLLNSSKGSADKSETIAKLPPLPTDVPPLNN